MANTEERETVWPEATRRLAEDPAFGPLVERVGPVRLRPARGTPFASLAAAIVYQQLAGAAAVTIHGRFVEAVQGDVTPESVLNTAEPALRGAGLSRAKLGAIRDLAEKARSGEIPLDDLEHLDDETIVRHLTRVRGIGPWTARMYLLFDLRRPDVWPVGDLGVRTGLARVLGLDTPPTARETEWAGIGYRPWRSAVAWYCWRAADTTTPDEGGADA
ncbi:MAG: DNA-3-methyladenine glycosylase 2 family protein [Gemmatimonadota bacterium]|jgi:DNA-3-methyladenine glycosylase II